MSIEREVSTAAEFQAAVHDAGVRHISVTAPIDDLPPQRLSRGQLVTGTDARSVLRFARGADGLRLSTDNRVENLEWVTDPDKRAVCNDTSVEHLGKLVLRNLTVTGVVRLLADDSVRGGHVEAHHIDIVAADVRAYGQGPKGYGVEVVTGAFTLWNRQSDPKIAITADLTGLAAGRAGAPVRGSGIFISGAGEAGGRLVARRLETRAVFSDGGIALGTPDRISGGVFVVSGAYVHRVHNHGPMTTYGPNDMVLDNWGTVDHWTADEKITSYGPSGIGFVNFGTIGLLQANDAIETFGQGSRGFNVYSRTVKAADFERIITHADGAVGIQLSQPLARSRYAAASRPTAARANPWSRARSSACRPLRLASSQAVRREKS